MMAEARRGQWTDQQLAAKAVELAESILKQSNAGMRGKEKRQAQQMERMMNDRWRWRIGCSVLLLRRGARSCSAIFWTDMAFPVICLRPTVSP